MQAGKKTSVFTGQCCMRYSQPQALMLLYFPPPISFMLSAMLVLFTFLYTSAISFLCYLVRYYMHSIKALRLNKLQYTQWHWVFETIQTLGEKKSKIRCNIMLRNINSLIVPFGLYLCMAHLADCRVCTYCAGRPAGIPWKKMYENRMIFTLTILHSLLVSGRYYFQCTQL